MPTTTDPSWLTRDAVDCVPPGRNPSPEKLCACATGTARHIRKSDGVMTKARCVSFMGKPILWMSFMISDLQKASENVRSCQGLLGSPGVRNLEYESS